MAAVGLSPMKLLRVLRAELGREPEAAERPLHRSTALRKIFQTGGSPGVGGWRKPAARADKKGRVFLEIWILWVRRKCHFTLNYLTLTPHPEKADPSA
jgi:hypothetical protein